ncbi:MAG TPA: Asp-tRNA(Asn)/Glu-tRNA(Gln) amidotransferase GatCAB subunit C [Bacteroidetes bacterium]|nr:Asp-tRNA(Asn)/Glu-tRNA(Gln) amidotransferase GatCAB subunit C [Bacteroidota bacterium]|tara:strand:+ start:108 stop:401 length:294 start_codon:yes stop_codon:yes gene_type:complete
MNVDVKLVERLASLTKLSFDKEEKQRLVKDLERMIGFIDTLDQLDLSNEEPMTQVHQVKGRLRSDETVQTLAQEEVFHSAPSHDGTYFKVPKVIKGQ